jgi:hypothetical protein
MSLVLSTFVFLISTDHTFSTTTAEEMLYIPEFRDELFESGVFDANEVYLKKNWLRHISSHWHVTQDLRDYNINSCLCILASFVLRNVG